MSGDVGDQSPGHCHAGWPCEFPASVLFDGVFLFVELGGLWSGWHCELLHTYRVPVSSEGNSDAKVGLPWH